jgi:hypothetical protein
MTPSATDSTSLLTGDVQFSFVNCTIALSGYAITATVMIKIRLVMRTFSMLSSLSEIQASNASL